MYPVTDRFLEALRKPHKAFSRAEVVDGESGQIVIENLKFDDGFVRVDRTNDIRRSTNLSLPAFDDYIPDPFDHSHPLHPLAKTELKLYRGIEFSDSSREEVPLGVFGIYKHDIDDGGDAITVSLQADDRAREVQSASFNVNYVVPLGSNFATAIQDLLEDRRPGRFEYDFVAINALTPQMILGGSGDTGGGDPWEHAQKMAASIAHDVYFDVIGKCLLRELPLIGGAPPVARYVEGESLLLSTSRGLDRSDVHNHVIVFGETSSNDVPVKGEIWDDDPASTTYAGDPVGSGFFYSPTWLRSPYVRTEEQANELANARIKQTLNIRQSVQFTSIVNPAHEAGDIILLRRARSKIDQELILESFTVPLRASQAMNATVVEGRSV